MIVETLYFNLQVVRELVKYTENFRVLALSATPGSDIKVSYLGNLQAY